MVVFAPSYYPARGGVEKHLAEVYGLLKDEFSITVFVRYAPNLPAKYTEGDIRVIRLPRSDRRQVMALWAARYWRTLRAADCFHSHDVFPALVRRLFPRTRWVHTFHGYEGYPLQPQAIASRQRVRQLVDYAFGVGQFIEKWYGTPCDEVMYGATNLRPPHPAPAQKWSAIFYGRLEPDTGFKAYLEGFKLLHDQQPNATLMVLGNGSQQAWAEDFIARHHLPVTLHDMVPAPAPYVEQARVALVSGYQAIAESAALGKPIVAVYETPIKHDYLACHPLAKTLSITRTPAEIAAAAQAALKLPADDAGLHRAQVWAFKQTWQRVADRYAAQYRC
ncbi:MAG TPA: glycosyltransferase family 4 protein [Candidatus Saccharimonadia bacterium]|nr:glycosyltransferase family 4 protein [Candidatus Saccharimonadia bacterium]